MIELRTPSGYTVTFKDYLDTKGFREVRRATAAQTQITQGANLSLPATALLDAEEVALRHMIVDVVKPNGEKAFDPIEAVGEMPFQDGDCVYAKVNELTEQVQGEEPKNDSAVSSNS